MGPIVGAGLIVAIRNVVSNYLERWPLVLGAIFMLTVVLAPNGLVGWLLARQRRAAAAGPPPAGRDRLAAAVVAGPAGPAAAAEGPGGGIGARAGPPALELRSVSRAFDGLLAVNEVSFALVPGERVAVLGPNGAGKTTLFNLISGTLRVSAGAIWLFGEAVTAMPPHQRTARGLARTFQVTTLFPALSVVDNVRLAVLGVGPRKFAMLRPVDALDEVTGRAKALLDRFDLGGRRAVAVRALSHGEQRMLEILLALASGPRVLLLDEPTSGVAAGEVEPIVRMVRELDPEMTVLIIEHDMDVAFRLAERILVLHYGQLLRSGTPEEIRMDPLVAEEPTSAPPNGPRWR